MSCSIQKTWFFKLTDPDNRIVVTKGGGGRGGARREQGGRYMVTEGDSALGGEHILQHTDGV